MKYLSVALVDDEEIVLEDLEILIDWKKNGFYPVYKAHTAKQGLELVSNTEIDILFLDIMLPGMDGLEMAARVRACRPDTQIVILSSYREFSYAARAIEAGVYKYMLKHELTPELLLETLDRIRERILENEVQRIAMMQGLLHDIAFRGEVINQSAVKKLSALGGRFRLAALMLHEKGDPSQAQAAAAPLHVSFLRGISSRTLAVTNILAVSDRILIFAAAREKADTEDNQVFLSLLSKVLNSLEEAGSGRFLAIYADRSVALEELYEVNQRISEAIKSAGCAVGSCVTIEDALSGENQSYTPSTRFIIRYVKEHFRENITLAQIADEVHGNSMYIGQCFIKDVGVSFRSYLNTYRIEKAKGLLSATNYRVFEISEKVGILNSQYFSKIFREETGLTPNEYRERNYHA